MDRAEELKQLSAGVIHSLCSLQAEEITRWFDEDAKLWIPPAAEVEGKRRIQVMFKLIYRRYSSLSWVITHAIPVDDRSIFLKLDSEGMFANGKPYKNHIFSHFEFNEKNLLASVSDYFKDTSQFL